MRQKKYVALCLIYLLGITAVTCQIYAGSILANDPSFSANYTLATSPIGVSLIFKIKEQYSNLIIIADVDPIPSLDITPQALSNYYLQNHTILRQMDIPRAIAGTPQLINLKIPNGSTTLYLMVCNLDLPNILINKTFTIEIVEISPDRAFLCYECPYSTRIDRTDGVCQCKPCPQNTYGPACEYYQKTIEPKNAYNVSFYKVGNLYFRIVNPPQVISLYFTELSNTNSSTLFIQYEVQLGGIAGYLNTYYDNNNKPYSYAIINKTSMVTIETKKQNLSLTIACRQPLNTLITLSYSPAFQKSEAALGMILGLGIGIPIAIIIILIVIVILFCRQRTLNGPLNAPVNDYLLTLQEIQRYLPQVPSTLILKSLNLDQSKHNFKEEAEKQKKDDQAYQCCICLIQIAENQTIRVGYCKHFFHSKCLSVWFAKNQICPYCRREFNYPQTLAAYQKLKGDGPDLFGQQLVQAIFNQQKEEQNVQNHENNEQQNINIEQVSIQGEIQQSQSKSNEKMSDTQENLKNLTAQQRQIEQHKIQTTDIPNIKVITPTLGEFQIE